MEYDYVADVIKNFFNYSHGLSTNEDELRLLRALEHAPYKENLSRQVQLALSDENFSWLLLLKKYDFAFNHEIETEEQARHWARVFLFEKYLSH